MYRILDKNNCSVLFSYLNIKITPAQHSYILIIKITMLLTRSFFLKCLFISSYYEKLWIIKEMTLYNLYKLC